MENDIMTKLLEGGATCLFCGENAPDRVCPDCEAKNEESNRLLREKEALEKQDAREEVFRRMVGIYADTEIDRLPSNAATRAARDFVIGGSRGLTLTGPGDTGKTRAAVWIGIREMRAGRWVEFRQCGELRHEVIQHAKNGEWGKGVSSLMNCSLLILDDFGNHEMTRTAEEFFLALLERRTSQNRPTCLTTQYSSKQLVAMFKTAQMADAVLRRIGRGFATMANTATNEVIR